MPIISNHRSLAMFFSEGSRPVSINEFSAFWSSLSTDEKDYYRKEIASVDFLSDKDR